MRRQVEDVIVSDGMLATATRHILTLQGELGRPATPDEKRAAIKANTKWRRNTITAVLNKLPTP